MSTVPSSSALPHLVSMADSIDSDSYQPTILAKDDPAFLQAAREYVEAGDFSGVLLARRGNETVRYHGGIANHAWNVPMTADARFELYSVSKTITAIAVLRSIEDGVLELDQPVCDILTFCPDSWSPVTVEHLLTHRSGLSSPGSMSEVWTGDFLETMQVTFEESDKDLSPSTQPGEKYAYSNFGYRLLAATLEAATSKPIQTLFDDLVFEPAGMNDALAARGAKTEDIRLLMDFGERGKEVRKRLIISAGPISVPRLVSGYDGNPETLIHVDVNGFTNLGASGVYATADDLQALLEALFVERSLLSDEMLEAMMTPAGEDDSGYGYGLMIQRSEGGVKLFHTGGINGFQIHAGYYPETDGMVLYMSNHGFAPFLDLIRQMEAWAMDDGE